ncbi:MAG: TRAP transporter substrate-binding protein [Gammaproteobacteria bacterium]|nr:TRAP transporter substrate-binding protein [Gammaproteobacteria bacterium]
MFGAKTIKAATLMAVAGGLFVTAVDHASAAKRVRWKMQSAWSTSVPLAGESGVRFSKEVEDMSEGNFQIKFYDPGALVPALECFDAASKGSVEACWTTPGYHTGKYPGLAFATTVPFGPQIGEFLAWKWHGGGNDIRDEIYAKHNLIAFDCFSHGPETSGWFKKPIESLDELRGLKMRFFGLGARVMQKLGVSTQLLAGADIYPALEKGVIDATEYSMPINDIKYGFYQISKNNYYPGWHQQVSVSELLMNRDAYNELPDAYKAMIKNATLAQVIYTYADGDARNFPAMQEMKSKYGVTNHRWTDEQLAAFEKAWNEVVQEESAKDEYFKRFADSYFAFREQYRIWGEAQSLKSTYLK